MKRFSWYTDDKTHISTYINGAPKKRYLVVDGIAVIGRAVMNYKPNRKGGHTHNHVYNKCHKHIFRSKQARKKVDREDIMKNQDRTCRTCAHCNLACRLDSVGSGDSIFLCTEQGRGVHESDTCDKWVQHRRRV